MTAYDVVGSFVHDRADLAAAEGVVKCLLAFLKGLSAQVRSQNRVLNIHCTEPTSTNSTQATIVDAAVFVKRLLSCLTTAQSLEASRLSTSLVTNCCAVLLEASLRSNDVWENFKAADEHAKLFKDLLLLDERVEVRADTAKCLKGIFSVLPR